MRCTSSSAGTFCSMVSRKRRNSQERRGAVQGLNLALLVHAQHQSAVGRVQIKADDVANFVDEQRIATQLEGLAAMGLQRKGAPDAANAALAEPRCLSPRAGGPVRGS